MFCMFGVLRPTPTSLLPMKGCKFLLLLGTHGHCLACHTYCPFIMDISGDLSHSHLLPSVWQWSCHYLILRVWSVAAGIRTPNPPHARRTLYSTAPPPRDILVYTKTIPIPLNHYNEKSKDTYCLHPQIRSISARCQKAQLK